MKVSSIFSSVIAVLAIPLLTTLPVSAQTVFWDNGDSVAKDAWTSDLDSTQRVADNFTVATPMVIERID